MVHRKESSYPNFSTRIFKRFCLSVWLQHLYEGESKKLLCTLATFASFQFVHSFEWTFVTGLWRSVFGCASSSECCIIVGWRIGALPIRSSHYFVLQNIETQMMDWVIQFNKRKKKLYSLSVLKKQLLDQEEGSKQTSDCRCERRSHLWLFWETRVQQHH